MMCIEVNLIVIGVDCWAALLADGGMLLSSTRAPKSECAVALLRLGMDPRSMLRIRAGSKVVAFERLGTMGGSPVVCSDVGVIERD